MTAEFDLISFVLPAYDPDEKMLPVVSEKHFFEFPIETIYFNQNAGTHFHPVKAGLRIYRVIFRFFFNRLGAFRAVQRNHFFNQGK